MRSYFIRIVFLLFCTALWSQHSLYYTLKKGDTYVIEQNAQQLITQEIEGITHELENNISGKMQFKVAGIKDDLYEIDMVFLDLGMHMNSNLQGELMSVDASEVIEGDAQSRIFNSLLNIPVRMILARSGNVLSVHGGDSLINKMTTASGITDSIAKNALKESLRNEFGSEALSNSFEQMTYIYPEGTNSLQGSWENEYSGKLSAKNIWTLEKSTPAENYITGIADIEMDIEDEGTSMSLSGKQETTVTADIKTGFILDMLVEGYSEGTAMMSHTGDMEIPTTIKSTTRYKLITN
ncbi:MAG: DUF6263 family protein [Flavobacteriaceae bacterium]